MRKAVIIFIRGYRLAMSPFLGNVCRFHPSCSHYAEGAIARHGLIQGGWMALCRILRCHPFHAGGLDPVPDKADRHSQHG